MIDSDGDLYLVGFGDATDSGYLTSNGQWGNGNDLPETMEFGSFMAAYYNDSTEGINNLAVLPALAGVGVTFDQTMVTFNGTEFFVPGYACVDGVLHMYNNGVDVGWFYDDDSLVGHGHLDCEGGIVSGSDYPGNNHELLSPSVLTVERVSAQSYRDAFYTLVMILTGHINYTWAE